MLELRINHSAVKDRAICSKDANTIKHQVFIKWTKGDLNALIMQLFPFIIFWKAQQLIKCTNGSFV